MSSGLDDVRTHWANYQNRSDRDSDSPAEERLFVVAESLIEALEARVKELETEVRGCGTALELKEQRTQALRKENDEKQAQHLRILGANRELVLEIRDLRAKLSGEPDGWAWFFNGSLVDIFKTEALAREDESVRRFEGSAWTLHPVRIIRLDESKGDV